MMMDDGQGLIVEKIAKNFGQVEALKDVDLEVRPGEFFTLLGPSGCGKTTLLRIIAGLELADFGRIRLGDEEMTRLPATRRPVNMVFQNYALFPHLNVFENVAFGLRSRKFPDSEVRSRVNGRLEMLGIEKMADRRPHQLSGGQKQRVALARALVNEPRILLLDEPMSALDARLRSQVQEDLRRLQRQLGHTFILVTHDQAEALVCSDRIAVMRRGRIIQYGTPREVYESPRTRFVAEFLGAANLIQCRRLERGLQTHFGLVLNLEDHLSPSWKEGTVAIRPEWIRIHDRKPEINGLEALVREVVYRGSNIDFRVEPGGLRVRVAGERRLAPGDRVWLELAPEDLVLLED